MPFHLTSIVPWGRSFDEYRRMFALTEADLAGSILGCADGPASFNSEATRWGAQVVSCDPLYVFPVNAIRSRIEETFPEIMRQTQQNLGEFVWSEFASPDELGQTRLRAMEAFLADFLNGQREGRYIAAELPALPFAEKSFDLAICSHFLFLYSFQLSAEFHLAAIDELLRVAREVRIFPIVAMGGEPSEHLPIVLNHLSQHGCTAGAERVDYEFVRGAHEMLRVNRPA